MDGIALELWNKKLLMGRNKRQQDYKTCVELSVSRGYYSSSRLPSVIYEAAAENLDVLILHWKETFQGSWQRQNPTDPLKAAQQVEGDILSILATERQQIESEIQSLAANQEHHWTAQDLQEGKTYLERKVAVLSASCREQIANLRSDRETQLAQEKRQKEVYRKELIQTRIIGSGLVLISALTGVWLGAYLNATRSRQDRDYIDMKMKEQLEAQHQLQDELYDLRKSNRKIAFWTEKTPAQIDAEIQEIKDHLNAEVQDIHDETTKRIARLESDYARAGKQPDMELDMGKKALLNLQAKRIAEAQEKAQNKLDQLEDQKQNLMK